MESTEQSVSWALILTKVRDEGAAAIACYYSGGGDSGAIEHIGYLSESFIKEKGCRTEDGTIDPNYFSAWEHDGDIDLHADHESEIHNFIENQCYNYLMKGFDDWYNNDGGEGVIIIDTVTGKWTALNRTFYTESNDHNHEGKLSDL